MAKLNKTWDEFVNHMHTSYPLDSQLAEREGMLKAYKFLSGEFDEEEKERKKYPN